MEVCQLQGLSTVIKEYIRLGRPINALAGCISVFLSAWVVGPHSWTPVITAAMAVVFITVSSNAWNDYRDLEIDRINKPERPLPVGKIHPRGALVFSVGSALLSVLVAVLISWPAFLIVLGSNVLLYLYSWKLKCSVLFGNATVAFITALCFVFGGVAAGDIQPTLMLAVTVFFAIAGREVLKTIADHAGDAKYGCRTIAVSWGKPVARIFAVSLIVISFALMIATFFTEQFSRGYLYLILLGLFPLFSYSLFIAKPDAPQATIEWASTLMKYGFFIWFLAVLLGAG